MRHIQSFVFFAVVDLNIITNHWIWFNFFLLLYLQTHVRVERHRNLDRQPQLLGQILHSTHTNALQPMQHGIVWMTLHVLPSKLAILYYIIASKCYQFVYYACPFSIQRKNYFNHKMKSFRTKVSHQKKIKHEIHTELSECHNSQFKL